MVLFTPKRLRIIKTCNFYISSALSGMSMAVVGPTLLDLQHVVKTDTKHIAFVFTGRSSGYLLGSLIGGVIFDMSARKQFFMTILNFIIAVSMFAMPWSRSIEILTAWMVLNGMSMGALDTGLNVGCLNLWGKDNGPFYQALHFAYGFGGLIAPLVAAPFIGQYLSPETSLTNSTLTFANQTTLPANLELENTFDNLTTHYSADSIIPPVFYGYAIIGGLAIFVTVLFIFVCVIAPLDDMGQKNDQEEVRKRGAAFVGVVVFSNFLITLVETGTEIGYAQTVATYAVKGPLKLTPATGSYLTSTFWGAFTLSRFTSIFLAVRFSSLGLILFDLLVTSVGGVVLLFLAPTAEWAVWLASFLLGFGIAPFFPTAIAWIEQYITVTNKFVALFATGAAIGEMVIPYTITHFIDDVPEALSYVVTATCVLAAVLIFCQYLILKNRRNKYQAKEGIPNDGFDANVDTNVAT